ncbi:GrlR family regulatory protein [Oleidesulfovibrio sp.]|uniref:GrlR family regulatory protein n=1 Tax=Oleidesulfovibrio sp. TaxID=2909707 RepID=UPI003A86A13B
MSITKEQSSSLPRDGNYQIRCVAGTYEETGTAILQHGTLQGTTAHNSFTGELRQRGEGITGRLDIVRTGSPEHMGLGRFKTAPLTLQGHSIQDNGFHLAGTANGHTVIRIEIFLHYQGPLQSG